MNRLEKIVESITYDEASSFRLFLTALPTHVIPISIIQNSIKMTNEPPKGMKQSIKRNYNDIDEKFFESCKKPTIFKRLLYGFCFFHALIIERKKFGALGWNSSNYQFSPSDFSISRFQLKNFLDDYAEVQWEALNYMIAQANYGGIVTDPSDRVLIKVIFADICNPAIQKDTYKFSGVNEYPLPPDSKYEDHIEFINQISSIDPTSIFGMHENADITCAINETNSVFNNILLTLPRIAAGGAGKTTELSPDEIVKNKAQEILNKLEPFKFNIEEVRDKHPLRQDESLNSVLHQELMRYNNLISTVNISMKKLIDAINGDAVMTSDLELITIKMFDNKLPDNISAVSYPSLKPLGSWVNDFIDKLKFMQQWIDNGIPNSFWISGFFFTQSFLTGILQNYARKYTKAIDLLKFDFEVMTNPADFDMTKKPEDGCYCSGFFIEGASWDYGNII